MGELYLHNYGFTMIPEPAQPEFANLMRTWYEGMCYQYPREEFRIPYIESDMLNHGRDVQEVFSNFFYEVRMYVYARGRDDLAFPEQVFPIDDQMFVDLGMDEEQAYHDSHWALEMEFFSDMRKYLDGNRMFYHSIDPKWGFHNMPIREVW